MGDVVGDDISSGKAGSVSSAGGKMSLLMRTFDRAMGGAVNAREMAIATRYQVWFLPNEPSLAQRIPPQGTHDACFMPRPSHVTRHIDTHEIAWGRAVENSWSTISLCSKSEELKHVGNVPHAPQPSAVHSTLWMINTQHCCLCMLDERFSHCAALEADVCDGIEAGSSVPFEGDGDARRATEMRRLLCRHEHSRRLVRSQARRRLSR